MSDVTNIIPNIVAALCSVATLTILVRDRYSCKKLEKVRISVTPKAKFANCFNEIFFLSLAFVNESSLPITIQDINIPFCGKAPVTDSSTGFGGTMLGYSIPVSESKREYQDSDIKIHDFTSSLLPITLAPFSSYVGFFAFHAGHQDAAILCNKELLLRVITSRKTFENEISLMESNFYDFTYYDDGTKSGKGVIKSRKKSLRSKFPKM